MKKSTFRKVISIVLACTMIFSMFSICASAEETNPKDHYVIYDNSLLIKNANDVIFNDVINDIVNDASIDEDSITELFISSSPELTNISSAFNNLLYLETINANNCKISTIADIYKLSNLTTVYLENNRIFDISPIGSMDHVLDTLDLANNFITNIYPLFIPDSDIVANGNEEYYHLDLDNNFISDIQVFKSIDFDESGSIHINGNYIDHEQIEKYFDEADVIEEFKATQKTLPLGTPPYLCDENGVIRGYFGSIYEEHIVIPNTMKKLDVDNHIITDVDVDANQIGRYAIKDNPNIKSVEIANGVNTLGIGAFLNCINLQRVELSPNTTTISNFAFSSCFELAGIAIPATTTTIGNGAFRFCYRLKAVEIENANVAIHQYAFRYCYPELLTLYVSSDIKLNENTNLSFKTMLEALKINRYDEDGNEYEVTIDNSSYEFENRIVTDVNRPNDTILKIPGGILGVNDSNPTISNSIKSVVIPEGVTSLNLPISDTNLVANVSVLLPETLTTITSFIPQNTAKSVTVYCKSTANILNYYQSNNNVTYNTNFAIAYDILEKYTGALTTSNSTVIIPSDLCIDIIGAASFHPVVPYGSLMRLTSVVFPNGISEIREGAFNGCIALTNVNLNTDGALKTIGVSAFYYCNNLVSIAIPPSVTSIGAFAFGYCDSLETVQFDGVDANGNTIESQLTSFGRSTFKGCEALNNNIATIENIFVIPEGVTYLNEHLFEGCTGFVTMELPDNIVLKSSIHPNALENCVPPGSKTIICSGAPEAEFLRIWLREILGYNVVSRSLRYIYTEGTLAESVEDTRTDIINQWIENNTNTNEIIDETIIDTAIMNYVK